MGFFNTIKEGDTFTVVSDGSLGFYTYFSKVLLFSNIKNLKNNYHENLSS